MTMNKTSSEGIPCTYCNEDALPDTDPPVCANHLEMSKKASGRPETMKELDAKEAGDAGAV